MAYLIMGLLFILIGLYLSFRTRRIRLLNGVWVTMLILLVAGIVTELSSGNVWMHRLWVLGLSLFIILVGLAGIWIGWQLVQTAWLTRRNHRYRLVNATILIVLVICCLFTGLIIQMWLTPEPRSQLIVILLGFISGYFIFWWFAYGIGFLIYRHQNQTSVKSAYVLVLGAGLNYGNQVSLSLQARLDQALLVAKQLDQPWLILSGGKGGDETISEAEAMATYCEEKGYPRSALVLETASTSTAENMMFTKAWLIQHGLNPTAGVFVTSDYHTYRAALLAQKIGVTTHSVGAKTAPKAFWHAYFREYCAIMFQYRWRHAMALVVGLGLVFYIFVN